MNSVVSQSEFVSQADSQSLSSNLDDLVAASFSPRLRGAARIQKELVRRGADNHFLGGIVHEAVRGAGGKIVGNVVHIANPYEPEPLDVVTLPTRCSKEEIEKIRSRIIPMRETYEILMALAKAYEQRQPILIEGDTSIGKTFIVNRFMELIYGKGARPIDFYCSGQTDVSELIGKWAPKTSGLSDTERKLLDDFLQSSYGANKVTQIQEEVTQASDTAKEVQHALLKNKLSHLLDEIGLKSSVQWEFSYGAVPKAMMCNVETGGKNTIPKTVGAGTILKVDEVGLAEPAVVMALLRIRGEAGKLAESIQLWEAGGEVVHAGPDFFMVYTTNPSDKDYIERKEIDPALARSVIWLRKGSLSEESLSIAAEKYLTFSIGNDPGRKPLGCVIDLREETALGRELAEIAAVVHRRYLEVMKNGEAGRRQKLPGSLDHLARLASYMLSNQVTDPKSNQVDFSETLKRAVKFVYLSGLVDEKILKTMDKELNMLLADGSIGVKEFKGKKMKRNEILTHLSEEAHERRVTKSTQSKAKLSLSDKQMYYDISDSLLAQLEVKNLSLQSKVLPQIEEALEMFSENTVKEDLLEEIASKEQPSARSKKEWQEFLAELIKVRERVTKTNTNQRLVA